MRTLLTLFAFVCCFGLVRAQQINNVLVTPQNPTTCNLIDMVIQGTLPQSGEPTGASPSIVGDSLVVTLLATGGSSGSSNFSQPIQDLGPFAVGTYTLVVVLVYNGNEADTWSTTITVVEGTDPYAGEYGETVVCNSDPNFPLISILGGTPDPGGVWYNPINQVVSNGQFDPGQSLEGFYTYVFDVVPPCQDAAQQILVTYTPNNSAGTNGTVQVCASGGASVDLFTELGGSPTTDGTWAAPGGGTHSNVFTPGVDACGAYVYTVPGLAPCGDVSSTVTVQCVQPPNAGTNTSWAVCWNDSTENLNAVLQGEPNTGSWVDPFGFVIGGFNAQLNLPLHGPGNYGYVVSSTVCPGDTAFVAVTINNDPDCAIGMEEFEAGLSRFELAPNPATDQVALELEAIQGTDGYTLELIDVKGQVILNERLRFNGTVARRTIDVAALAKGAYLVRITSPNGPAVRRLMVK